MEDTSSFVNSEGSNISCRYWYPPESDNSYRAAVFICHGAGEHCQAYTRLASQLAQKNLIVFAHDHVGHGLSDGDRVHVSSVNVYVDDVLQHAKLIQNKYPGIRLFAIGHSLGGAIMLKLALDHRDIFSGIVFIGPAIVADPALASPILVFIGRLIARIIPQYQVKSIDPNLLSHDPAVVQKYIEDPLTWHGGLKAWWGLCILDLCTELCNRLTEVDFPFYVVHGMEDKLCDPSGAQMLFDKATTSDKRIQMIPNAFHQVHKESEGRGEQVVSEIINWITERRAL